MIYLSINKPGKQIKAENSLRPIEKKVNMTIFKSIKIIE